MRSAAVALLLLAGCAAPLSALRAERPLELEGARFVLKSDGRHEDDVTRVERVLRSVPSKVARWGGFREPITVYVVATHLDLEAAVARHGFDWLRAWARYDDIVFQAPSTWTNSEEVIEELLVHEATHCLLFQSVADGETWLQRSVPLWFREGMAIATARQQRHYPSLEDSARWLEADPTRDPFRDGDALSRRSSADVYGVALHAFVALEERAGVERLRALMAAMRGGATFEAAFERTLGFSVEQFVKDFRAFLAGREFLKVRPANGLR